MASLKGKHILLGVTGSIAAYKSAMLIRALVKEGAEVRVVMTEMAKHFITPLTLATLSKNPIAVEFYNPENGDWNSHVSLGLWADLMLIAPVTANTMGKMVTGVADNLLITSYLSAKCPVAIAPAMDLDMYKHPSTQENMNILRRRGVYIVEPSSGELASGLEGKGRMEEPDRIVAHVEAIFAKSGSLSGKKMLISAGPTCEDIDPVRYITNHSSGKMGYAIAHEAANRGAEVTIISGPVNVELFHPNVKIVNVKSAKEMFEECKSRTLQSDMIVLCAAVADFTVNERADKKIKREKADYSLTLTPTRDIAAWVGENKREDTFLTGFALETNDELENARGKLKRKNLDMIVLNSMQDAGAGFRTDTNKITIIVSDGTVEEYQLKSKRQVAVDIIDKMEKCSNMKPGGC